MLTLRPARRLCPDKLDEAALDPPRPAARTDAMTIRPASNRTTLFFMAISPFGFLHPPTGRARIAPSQITKE
jgi:hypothetical protein